MNSDIKEILKNTLNPNTNVIKESEKKLAMLQKDYNFLLSIPHTLMKDSDIIIKKTSCFYFKNAIVSEWKEPAFSESKSFLISHLLDLYIQSDDTSVAAFNDILVHMLNTEPSDVTNSFISNASQLIKTNDMLKFTAALNILEQIYNADKVKYQLEALLNVIYNTCGQELVSFLHVFLEKKDYKISCQIVKFIAKSYNYYTMPEFLNRIDVFSYTISTATQILMLQNNSDLYMMKCKKWAACFLYKSCNKGVKKFYKNSDLSDFITTHDKFQYIYDVFISQLKMEKDAYSFTPIELYTVEFLTMCASDRIAYKYLERDLIFLITDYILKAHELTDSEEDDFTNDAEKFMREKYHYFNNNVRNECGTLFCEIVKNIKDNANAMNWLYGFFTEKLETWKQIQKSNAQGSIMQGNMTESNKSCLRTAYAVYYLMSNISHTLYKFSKQAFEKLLTTYVFYELKHSSPIMKSQACFFLSFVEEEIEITQAVMNALEDVVCLIRKGNNILKVDSTLSMNFFISNKEMTNHLKQYIGEIIGSILTLSAENDIEPLTYLLDNIMQTFVNEVKEFSPNLVRSLGNLILGHLTDDYTEKEDKIMVISGFLRSVETIITSADNSKELSRVLYDNFHSVLYFIFSEKKDHFYQEALDIASNFFYSINVLDNTMWSLFLQILSLPKDELILFPTELSEIIDNCVCNGKEVILDEPVINKLDDIVKTFCYNEDDEPFEDDFIAGCKIMETLLLNLGDKLLEMYPIRLQKYVEMVIDNMTQLDSDCSSTVYGLEVLMNCFYLKPIETYHCLRTKEYDSEFLSLLFTKRAEFRRVHDKKICVRFLGRLFSVNPQELHIQVDYTRLCRFFVSVFCSLPEAIENRNKLMDNKGTACDVSDKSDYDADASDEYYDLEEDIYFFTVLDSFDAYTYIFNILATPQPNTVGSVMMSYMKEDQMNAINEVFSKKRHVQQK